MTDEEKKEYEKLKSLLYTGTISQYGKRKLIDMFEKQQKEIEELKKPKYVINCKTNEITKLTNDFVSKDKIKAKILECRKILYSFEKELELKANKEKYIHKESMNCLLSQISILQSLLEKE